MPKQKPQASHIEVDVSMRHPWTHYFEVTLSVSGIRRDHIDFVMPVWTPGSYLIREYPRNVQEFSAASGGGRALGWRKRNKNTWRVQSRRLSKVTVSYRVHAFDLSVRTSYLDDSHGCINGASLFMYPEGGLGLPYTLRVHPFPGWNRISTGLEPAKGKARTYVAPDFDILVDSPIEIGCQKIMKFSLGGIRHFISVYGEGNPEPVRLRADIRKIVKSAAELMGGLPYRHYSFLIQLLPEGSGGLEHMNSMLLQVNRWTFRPEDSYRKFLSLVAHEFFHLWNVKRMRPASLGPFDYTKENYTRLLWVSEGFTDYFADQIVLRAGLMTPEQYLDSLSRLLQTYLETPGRFVQSAAEASFDAWIKHYRQDSNSPNSSISYYLKGGLIAFVLDLEIRRRRRNRSLDDLMRFLYGEYYQKRRRGFTEAEFLKACNDIGGRSLGEMVDRYAYRTEEIDFSKYLDYAGLRLQGLGDGKPAAPKSYLGMNVKSSDGKVVIVAVPSATPAYDYGLNVNDEVVGLDGFRVSLDTIGAQLEEKPPGTRIEVLVSRAGKLRLLPVVLGEKKAVELQIIKVKDAGEEKRRLYESWLRTTWQAP